MKSENSFLQLITIDSIVIVGSSNSGLLYSEDNGKTWNKSNISDGSFNCLAVIGNTVIAGGDSNKGLLYSKNNGKTWKRSNVTTGDFECLTVVGNTVIAGSNSSKGLFYSEDKGKTWKKSNINKGYFSCLTTIDSAIIMSHWTICKSTVIAGNSFGKGLLYSEDNGKTMNCLICNKIK